MSINAMREQRRRDIARQEVEKMIRRYHFECGQPITRKATQEELNGAGRKTTELEHKKFLNNSYDTF